jgi:asparagine synthase (glutamine-hydrolysing)
MYVCALRPRGEPLSRADVFGYMARLRRCGSESIHSIVEGPFAVVALDRPGQMRARIARFRALVGAGDVRLDNRPDIAALAGVSADAHTDLELVLAAIDRRGEGVIAQLLGDFAFVCWDPHAQKLLAARDAFGVKPLFSRAVPGLQLLSSDIAPLLQDETYDLDYIAEYLHGTGVTAEATIWRGVSAVGAGTLMRQRGTVQSSERYWRVAEFEPDNDGNEADNCAMFRDLLAEAISIRADDPAHTWAQLSGGLDSSSVVAFANALRERGSRVANTITIVDSLGDGDERIYSDAVVQKYQLRNEQVRDYWAWQDDGEAPPLTDQPSAVYPFYARDRRVWDIVRSNGGRVLLSGLGADHYLYGSLDYITDMAMSGRFRDALGEITTWSIATRQSFWQVGRRYLLEPFLSRQAQVPRPQWLTAGVRAPLHVNAPYGRMRGRFASKIAIGLSALPSWIERWPFGHELEMRYPFLYRPLVEWSLRLPPKQRVRPNARKWILREATRDVLPEQVRTRSTKGGIDARILWSLQREKPRLDAMLRDPILAQLGCVEPRALRTAVEDARRGVPVHNVQLFSALALETWLAVRTGRWSTLPQTAVSAA